MAEFKKYTPDSFELKMINRESRPDYNPDMNFGEVEKYSSAMKKYGKENGRLMIEYTASGDKFIVSEKVTNSDDITINPEKLQTALTELSLEKIKTLSKDFNNIIQECEDKVKKESSKDALEKIFSNRY